MALERLQEVFYSEQTITVMWKDLDPVPERRGLSRIDVTALVPRHLAGLSRLNRKRGRRSVDRRFRSNLDRGLHGFVGLVDGDIVGYYWWVEGERRGCHPDFDWLGDFVRLEEGDVYASDLYFLPEYRGGGVAAEFLSKVEASLKRSGFKRVWGYVDARNRQARWLYSSRGYKPMKDLVVRKRFFRRRTIPVSRVGSPSHERRGASD